MSAPAGRWPLLWIAAAASVISSAASSIAVAAEARFQPTVELELSQTWERLEVDFGPVRAHEDRWLWAPRMGLGLSVDIAVDGMVGRLRSETTVGAGLTLATGHVPVHLRTQLLWEVELTPHVSLPIGVSTGFIVNTGAPDRSAWETGFPMGLRLWFVDILYHPTFTVPLGAEESDVFGGTRRLSAAPTFVPVGLQVRFRIPPLGFGAKEEDP